MNNSRRKRISKIADALNELKGQIDELYTRRSRKPSRTSLRACRGLSGMRLQKMRSICSNLHPPASKMSSRSSETRRADLWDVAMFI